MIGLLGSSARLCGGQVLGSSDKEEGIPKSSPSNRATCWPRCITRWESTRRVRFTIR